MKRMLAALLAVLALGGAAYAEERTVTLAVTMNCPGSEETVIEIALSRVPGVSKVTVSSDDQTAEVVYDDALASVADLVGALLDLGFEATERVADQQEKSSS